MRPIDADALYEDMLCEMCGTGDQSLALSVIRRAPTIAQQTNVKLDRNKWKGCDCCKGDLDGYTAQFRDAGGRSRPLYIPEGEAMIVASGKYNHQFCIPIGYCPHCGRPLTEKSWEELEKQVHDLTQPPNDPLTLEELREMDGEPVFAQAKPFRKIQNSVPYLKTRKIRRTPENMKYHKWR